MSIFDDEAWLEDGRRFMAELDRKTRLMLSRSYLPTIRARKVFRLIQETAPEWAAARAKKPLPQGP
jgi:hypothetical protein